MKIEWARKQRCHISKWKIYSALEIYQCTPSHTKLCAEHHDKGGRGKSDTVFTLNLPQSSNGDWTQIPGSRSREEFRREVALKMWTDWQKNLHE